MGKQVQPSLIHKKLNKKDKYKLHKKDKFNICQLIRCNKMYTLL